MLASIAALGLFAGAAVAQDYAPSEDDAVLLQMQVKKYRLLNEIRGYKTPKGACVDFADVVQALDLPIRVDRTSRRATGWIFAESQTITIERDANSVRTANESRPLQPGELIDTPEGWCVDTHTLGDWFGVSLEANLRDSVLVLDSERPLPFIEAIERKSRAARLRPERDRDLSDYPKATQPYALWRTPSVDVVTRADYHAGPDPNRLDARYEVFASGEIARASFDMRLASDAAAMPETLRLRAYRMDPEARMLGPLRATQAVAGDVDIPSGELAGAPGVGRGLFVSNRRLNQPSRFGTTILRGTLPLGWDAELYRNGQLLAFAGDSSDGRYAFEIDLVYGRNDLEVVLYGPQGQVRRESQSIPVGGGAVVPGKLEYWAGAIERNRDLVSFGRAPPVSFPPDEGWQYAAGLQYGLDRRTVIGASGHSLFLDARRRDYAEFNLQCAVGPMLLNLGAAQEFGRGRAYRADVLGKVGAVQVQAESFFVDGEFVSGLIGADEKSEHRVFVDTLVRLGRLPVPLAAGFSRTTGRGGRKVHEFLARGSLILPRLALTGVITRRDTERGSDWDDGTAVDILANTRLLGLAARGEVSYRLDGSRRGFEAASLTLEKMLDDRSDLRLDIVHTARTGVTDFELGYVHQLRKVALRAGGSVDSRGSFGASLALSFSFGPDPLGGGWRLSSDKLAQRGQAAVTVFLDENGDGRRSPGEAALPGVGVNAGQFGTTDPTDESGHAFVGNLQPYEEVLVSVDESTLPDPFLLPSGKGVVVTPRPGVPAVVELAVAPTGEVEGTIAGHDGAPKAGIELELIDDRGDVAARTMSEYDGFFLFDRVAYGRYRLQLADGSAAALGLPAELAINVELGPQRMLERVGIIRLGGPQVLASARGP